MKKVYISSFKRNGDKLVSAIGLLDEEAKVLYLPGYKKEKDLTYIREVAIEHLVKTDNGYKADTWDGEYVNTYYVRELTEKGETK